MPTERIDDLPDFHQCRDPDHDPAGMIVRPNGVYEHTCPSCGQTSKFIVNNGGML